MKKTASKAVIIEGAVMEYNKIIPLNNGRNVV